MLNKLSGASLTCAVACAGTTGTVCTSCAVYNIKLYIIPCGRGTRHVPFILLSLLPLRSCIPQEADGMLVSYMILLLLLLGKIALIEVGARFMSSLCDSLCTYNQSFRSRKSLPETKWMSIKVAKIRSELTQKSWKFETTWVSFERCKSSEIRYRFSWNWSLNLFQKCPIEVLSFYKKALTFVRGSCQSAAIVAWLTQRLSRDLHPSPPRGDLVYK